MAHPLKKRSISPATIARMAQSKIKTNTGMCVNLMICPENDPEKSPEKMLHVIAGTLGMDTTCYKLKSRARPIVELRFLASYFLRTYFPTLTLLHISRYFGALDHTTVINGLTRARDLIAIGDERFTSKYETVLNSVNQWLQKEVLGYGSAISA